MFKFTVVNLPSEAPKWAGFITISGTKYSVTKLYSVGEFWEVPVNATSNPMLEIVAVELYSSNNQIMPAYYGKNYQYGLQVSEGRSYQLDYQSNIMQGVQTGKFGTPSITTTKATVVPGSDFYINYIFDYTGDAVIGGAAVKVAMGHIYLGAFITFGDHIFIQVINLPAATVTTKISGQVHVVVPVDVPENKYAISFEVGPYPWNESRKFVEARVDDMITVSSKGQFKNLVVEVRKAAT